MRFFRPVALAIVSGAMLLASAIQAEASTVVFGNLGNSGTSALAPTANASVSDTTWVAQAFTVGGTNTILKTVTLGLYDNNNTVARVQLFQDVSGAPGGSAIATQTQAVGTLTPALQTFNFGSQSLTSGSSYWVVVSTTEVGGLFNWAFNNAGATPAGRNGSSWVYPNDDETVFGAKSSTNAGASWSDAGAVKAASISIQAVPEPSTYALAGIGMAAAGLMRWRRRQSGR